MLSEFCFIYCALYLVSLMYEKRTVSVQFLILRLMVWKIWYIFIAINELLCIWVESRL